MRVLLATATYPTPDRPSAGIFVRNQFRFFRRHATPDEHFALFKIRTHSRTNDRSWWRVLWSSIKFMPHFFRRYDIVHVHFISPLVIAARLYKILHPSTRLVLTVHGSGFHNLLKRSKRIKKRYVRALAKFNEVILAGESLLPAVQKELGLDSCRIICAGVDDLRFHADERAVKDFDFIFVGSFSDSKGVDILLQALESLEDEEIRVCFVGSGPLQKKLQRAGHHLNIQIFVDVPQTRLRQLYNASRFLVFPSRGDGFGLVVSEAIYCGVPAIISQDSGAGMQVKNNETGLSYKPNTPEKLSRVLLSAFNMGAEEYRQLSDNARQANLEFSLSHVGTQLMKLYRQLTAEEQLKRDAGRRR